MHRMFWNLPYPYGVADILRQDLINLNECGVKVQSGDCLWWKARVGKRVSQVGPNGRDTKINLLLAISGDGDTQNRWSEYWTGDGTTGLQMINFIQGFVNDVGQGNTQHRYCFIMDNLT
jgi:hypothetical protein